MASRNWKLTDVLRVFTPDFAKKEEWTVAWAEEVADTFTALEKRALLTALARDAGARPVTINEAGEVRILYPEGSRDAEMGYNGFVVPDAGRYFVIPMEDE